MKNTREVFKLVCIIALSILMLLGNTTFVQANITSTVTFHTNGGTIIEGKISSYTEGVETILPTNVIKAGHTFQGWYENSNLTGDPITKITASDTGDKIYYAKWQAVFSKMGYKEVSAGMYQTLAIDEESNLWSWGLNNNGQVGEGTTTHEDISNPIQIKPGVKFVQIATGNLFCLALDEDGNIWSFRNKWRRTIRRRRGK